MTTPVEADGNQCASARRSLAETQGILGGRRDGLLDIHMLARGAGGNRKLRVEMRGRADNHGVDIAAIQHLIDALVDGNAG